MVLGAEGAMKATGRSIWEISKVLMEVPRGTDCERAEGNGGVEN